jgi:type VI protein secretion system component Hcp
MIGDNFLWFPDKTGPQISGETTDDYFSTKHALEVEGFEFGMSSNEATEKGGGAGGKGSAPGGSSSSGSAGGKAKFGAISIEKKVDSASVPLYKACSLGTIFPTVMLVLRESGGTPLLYLQYIFRYNQITGISWSGGSGDKRPKEKVTFTFKAMGCQYIQQLPNGREGNKQQWSWNTVDQGVSSLTITGIDPPPNFEPGTSY